MFNGTTVTLDSNTALRTYTHLLMKTPYQITVSRIEKMNGIFGDYYNFIMRELSTGVEFTVSEANFTVAYNQYKSNYLQVGNALFSLDAIAQQLLKKMDRYNHMLEYNTAYFQDKMRTARPGMHVSALLCGDICFFMAETLCQLYEQGIINNARTLK
jgi:hypothetical protein